MNLETESVKKKPFSYKLGIFLIVISTLFWIIPILIPFAPITLKMKAGVITASLILAEVAFWGGSLLVGKEVIAKYKRYLRFKK